MLAGSRNRVRKRAGGGLSSGDLAQDFASLGALDTTALRQRCKALFGTNPSPHLGVPFWRAISYRIQETALVGRRMDA